MLLLMLGVTTPAGVEEKGEVPTWLGPKKKLLDLV